MNNQVLQNLPLLELSFPPAEGHCPCSGPHYNIFLSYLLGLSLRSIQLQLFSYYNNLLRNINLIPYLWGLFISMIKIWLLVACHSPFRQDSLNLRFDQQQQISEKLYAEDRSQLNKGTGSLFLTLQSQLHFYLFYLLGSILTRYLLALNFYGFLWYFLSKH